MKNILKYDKCYGCGVCSVICPRNIITMDLNDNGFYIPIIMNLDDCINCSLCLSTCSYNYDTLVTNNSVINSYAAWSNNTCVLKKCSSGGIVYEIAQQLIHEGYQFCSVRYNSQLHRAEHFMVNSVSDLEKTVGSKYIQSYTVDGFKQLNKKDKFLVIGAPCQIDSLRRYIIKKNIENHYILIDFFCHGVPSMHLWKKYIEEVQKKFGDVDNLRFRSKQSGWHDSWAIGAQCSTLNEEEKTYYFSKLSTGDLFFKMFLNDCCLGDACYDKCKFKHVSSSADIRVGDLWGEKYNSNNTGVSGVLTLTDKGENIIRLLNDKKLITLITESLNTVTAAQMKQSPVRKKYVQKIIKELKGRKTISQIWNKNMIIPLLIAFSYRIKRGIMRRICKDN